MEPVEVLPLLGSSQPVDTTSCPASPRVKSVCFKRASNRWSTLLTKTKSRIAHKHGMRKRLGEAHWAAFVKYAEAEYKTSFVRMFTPVSGELCCEGKLDGGPCPKRVRMDLTRISSVEGRQQSVLTQRANRTPRTHHLACVAAARKSCRCLRIVSRIAD